MLALNSRMGWQKGMRRTAAVNLVPVVSLVAKAARIICALDSRREIVNKNVTLAVKKEDFRINLVRLSENNFLQTLRNKLTWGLDKRN